MTEITTVPYEYTEKTFIVLPVMIDDSVTTKFILDTGIGLNLISKSICEKLECKITGTHSGKRMSGQVITVPVSSLQSLSLPGLRLTHVPVGVFDMEKLMPGSDIGGFLSLGFFRNHAFTVDYKRQVVVIENEDSLKKIRMEGAVVPIKLDKQDEALGVFLPPTGSA